MKKIFVLFLLLSMPLKAAVAPSFKSKLITGEAYSLAEHLKPNKALLISFWATWCMPCLEELRKITAELKNDPSLPVELLAINVDTSETSSDVKPTLKLHEFKMPVILDPKHEIFMKYQPLKTLPYSVLMDGNGTILQDFNGYHEEMLSLVRTALKEKGHLRRAD